MNENFWKYALAVGAGVALGAMAAMLLSRDSSALKKNAAALLGHGLDLKDKMAEFLETAKENVEDLAAEAKNEQARRKAGTA
jgi:gas vesicle protein